MDFRGRWSLEETSPNDTSGMNKLEAALGNMTWSSSSASLNGGQSFLDFPLRCFPCFVMYQVYQASNKNNSQTKIKTKTKNPHKKHKYHQAISEPSPPKKKKTGSAGRSLGPNLPRWIPGPWNPRGKDPLGSRRATVKSAQQGGRGFPGFFLFQENQHLPGSQQKTVLIYSYHIYIQVFISWKWFMLFLSGKEDISITIVHYQEDKLRTSPLKLYLHCSSTTFFRG